MVVVFYNGFVVADDIIPFNKHMDSFQVFLIVGYYLEDVVSFWWVFVRFGT
jgi:hypothetical protein